MANFCLPPELVDKVKAAFRSGELDPMKLAEAPTSEARRAELAKFVGEGNAKSVNALFESKLLLKNQKQGFATWAKKLTGLTAEAKRDIMSQIERLEQVLNPTETKQFLADLVEKRLGLEITPEEGAQLVELSHKVQEAHRVLEVEPGYKNEVAYGNTLLDIQDFMAEASKRPPTWEEVGGEIAGLPRGLQTTFDDSWLFNQGWGAMTFKEFWSGWAKQRQYISATGFRDLQAGILGSPYYELARKSGLRLTDLKDKLATREEAVQFTGLLEKIPVVGEGFKVSNRLFTGMANDVRFQMFKSQVEAMKLKGENVSAGSKELADIAETINMLTGSGNLGKHDRLGNLSPVANQVLYSVRKNVADLQSFNPIWYAKQSPRARALALRGIIGSTAVAASILITAKAFGAEVETDPTSSNWGTVKIGNTRIDVTGGKKWMVTLLARLVMGATKSSTSGKITKLNTGKYKAPTKGELVVRVFRNKLSPNASFLADWLYGEDTVGNDFNLTDALRKRVIPLGIQDIMTLYNEKTEVGKAAILTLMNFFGIRSSTY